MAMASVEHGILSMFYQTYFKIHSLARWAVNVHAVAEKPHDAVVEFDTYRNVQRHRVVLPAIARPLFAILPTAANLAYKTGAVV